jgi:putative ABC transport system ATP-binding protein
LKFLKGIDFEVKTGEFVAIMGRSGAGKSTFMYQLGLLDNPTAGSISIDGLDTGTLSNDEKILFSREITNSWCWLTWCQRVCSGSLYTK